MTENIQKYKFLKVFYGRILLSLAVVLLLGIASFTNRPFIFHSNISDFLIRLFLTTWFGGVYLRLSNISSFGFYPNKKWSKNDIGVFEKYFLFGMILLFSVGCGFITYWVCIWFFPSFSELHYSIAVLNGIIILFPLITHYWVIKL